MGWFQKLVYGVDLEEEQARSNNLNDQLAAMNKADLDSGKYDKATYAAAESNRVKSYEDEGGADVAATVQDAFDQSISENTSSIRKGLTSVITEPLKILFKLIPWPVWLAAAAFVFFYLGGEVWLRKLLAKVKAT